MYKRQVLKSGTSDSRKSWFAVGDYKRFENEVGGMPTTKPDDVEKEIKQLLKKYNIDTKKTFEEIIEFHYAFERIHPFQDEMCIRDRCTIIPFREAGRKKDMHLVLMKRDIMRQSKRHFVSSR